MLLALPAVANAAQRYAAPGSTVTSGCTAPGTSPGPCNIVSAINGSAANDEVIIESGSYGSRLTPLSTTLQPAKGPVLIHGAQKQPRPVIYSAASFGFAMTGGSTLSDVDIEQVGPTAALFSDNALIDHVIADGIGANTTGCDYMVDTTLIDSVCASLGGTGGYGVSTAEALSGTHTFTLRNDTVYASPSGYAAMYLSAGPGPLQVNVTNTILRGGAFDIQAAGGPVTATLDHSNYASTSGTAITPAGTGTNQTSPPLFVDITTGDLHELRFSPTVDAGATDSANGLLDLDGDARSFEGHTDIGAYEFVVPPAVTLGPANAIGPTSASLSGTVLNGAADEAQVEVQWGTTASYGHTTGEAAYAVATAPVPYAATLTGLPPNTVIHYRFVATNSGGTNATPDRTFTTLPLMLGNLRLHRRRFRRHTTVSYTDQYASLARFTVLRCTRHKHRRHCKPVRHFSHLDMVGQNSFRLKRGRLTSGPYLLQAIPILQGFSGQPSTVRFTIIS